MLVWAYVLRGITDDAVVLDERLSLLDGSGGDFVAHFDPATSYLFNVRDEDFYIVIRVNLQLL